MILNYISKRGDILALSSNEYFDLTNFDGQTSAAAEISSVTNGGIDGDTITNVRTQPRSIVMDLRIKNGVDVELAKREILKTVKLKQNGTLEWTQNNKTVQISGIVEAVEMPRWDNGVVMQITFYCSNPFWQDIEDVIEEISAYINDHYFTDNASEMLYFPSDGISFGHYDTLRTKSLYNAGDVSVGVKITILALKTVTNPIIYGENGVFFGAGYGTGSKQIVMSAGDIIEITTHKGNKTVKLNGTSIYDKIKPQSTWIQLQTGENIFSINSDDADIDNVSFGLAYKQQYI